MLHDWDLERLVNDLEKNITYSHNLENAKIILL